ncbi:MAG: YbhB/YbcL family Raf kinase inhibitor-like protein, partial [Thiohalorhabdaceae bacterium]
RLDVPEGAKVPEVESAAREHVLDEARLVGIYER